MDEPIEESWLIDTLQARLGALAQVGTRGRARITVPMAARDDCAILEMDAPATLVVGSDYIRGRQFDLFRSGHLDWFDLGYYLIGANLSDIAAMGADPVGTTLIFRYPPDLSRHAAARIVDGIATACEQHGPCPVLGGDSGGATDLVLSATVLATLHGAPLLRSNVAPGDRLWVVGYPGRARAAQRAAARGRLPDGLSRDDLDLLLAQWRRPQPRLQTGRRLATCGHRVACQDTSDGVGPALRQMARASGVDILVSETLLSVDPLVTRSAQALGVDPQELFFSGTVDFALVFSLPDGIDPAQVLDHGEALLSPLGVATAGAGMVRLDRGGGASTDLPGTEYRQ